MCNKNVDVYSQQWEEHLQRGNLRDNRNNREGAWPQATGAGLTKSLPSGRGSREIDRVFCLSAGASWTKKFVSRHSVWTMENDYHAANYVA